MKKMSIFVALLWLMSLATSVSAGTISNYDDTPYTCEVRDEIVGVQMLQVAAESEEGFGCAGGCEITLLQTGQTIGLESDADIEIENGVMKVSQ